MSETGALKMPDATSGIAYDPALAVKMTGVLVPPATGEYQLGAKGRDAFRLSLDGQVVIDGTQGGACAPPSSTIHLEKDKAYNLLVEFAHSPSHGRRGRGRGGFGRGGALDGRSGRRSRRGPTPARSGRGGMAGVPPQAPPVRRPVAAAEAAAALVAAAAADQPLAVARSPGRHCHAAGDPNADPLFQIAWTKPTADGSPANTAGQNLYGEAIDLAKKADAVVLVVGIDPAQEGENA